MGLIQEPIFWSLMFIPPLLYHTNLIIRDKVNCDLELIFAPIQPYTLIKGKVSFIARLHHDLSTIKIMLKQ